MTLRRRSAVAESAPPPTQGRSIRRGGIVAVLALAGIAGSSGGFTSARFVDTQTVGGNTLSTATLAPPTGLGATAECQGTGTARVVLTWTAAASATGYEVHRSTTDGGPYTKIADVGTVTTYTDPDRALNTTYYYVLKSKRNNWRSVNSTQAQATTPLICL